MSLTITGKEVGPIAFGLMGLTAPNKDISYDHAVKVMKAALDQGANFWNGGDFYGPPHANSLHLLRHYFSAYPEDRSRVVLSIKGCFSRDPLGPTNSPEGVRKSLDNCLQVLNGKCFIDIFEPARIDPKVPIETTVETLAEYVRLGKIGGIGLSECSANTIKKANAVHPIAAVEVELSLFSTEILTNGVTAACADLNIPIVAYSPLSRGFLTGAFKRYEDLPEGDPRRHMPRFQPEAFGENVKLSDEVKRIADEKGCSASQMAISWVKVQSRRAGNPVIIPLPGATSVARVEENTSSVEISDEELKKIEAVLTRLPVVGARYPPVYAASWAE